MVYKFEYKTKEEKETILSENADKQLLEERNITEGNFLIFSDAMTQDLSMEDKIKSKIGELIDSCNRDISASFYSDFWQAISEKQFVSLTDEQYGHLSDNSATSEQNKRLRLKELIDAALLVESPEELNGIVW